LAWLLRNRAVSWSQCHGTCRGPTARALQIPDRELSPVRPL